MIHFSSPNCQKNQIYSPEPSGWPDKLNSDLKINSLFKFFEKMFTCDYLFRNSTNRIQMFYQSFYQLFAQEI